MLTSEKGGGGSDEAAEKPTDLQKTFTGPHKEAAKPRSVMKWLPPILV